ncbi:Structural maintenance of chromosomes protein 4 [Homalodisca vitripennis]|nr:Structural maintenance of chromosomes protein 4 [Homalodisca vitripennis]
MKEKRTNKNAKDVPPPQPPSQNMDVDNSDEDSDQEEYHVQEGGINIPTREGNIYIPPAPPAVCSLDANGPRLIITHIENENFKSYAGRRVLGPFHKEHLLIEIGEVISGDEISANYPWLSPYYVIQWLSSHHPHWDP